MSQQKVVQINVLGGGGREKGRWKEGGKEEEERRRKVVVILKPTLLSNYTVVLHADHKAYL